jgi:hypothetical protein
MKRNYIIHAIVGLLSMMMLIALTGCQKELSLTDASTADQAAELEKRSPGTTFSGCETAFAKPDGNDAKLLDYVNANRWGWMANISLNPDDGPKALWPSPDGAYARWPIFAAAGRNVGGYLVGFVKVRIIRITTETAMGSKFDVDICFEDLLPGYVMEELHIYVGDQPTSVSPGQFTKKMSFTLKTASPGCFNFTDVRAQAKCDNVWIIIHAVVCKK